jgi:hypothetical protein
VKKSAKLQKILNYILLLLVPWRDRPRLALPFSNVTHLCRVSAVSFLACNETSLMHYASSLYSVTILLYVSGFLVSHHQEVTMYICKKWYVLYVLDDCQLAR